ncbi:MAG TPA: hypothetical protein GYA04_02935 [Acholeplasma sp.]|nr:hypothetical protein [Acholeplasma sp.]
MSKVKIKVKKKMPQIKVRAFAPDFSTHTRKTPSFVERQRRKEKKHKGRLANY